MKKIAVISAAAILAGAIYMPTAYMADHTVTFSCTEKIMTADGISEMTAGKPFVYNANTYVPVDDVLRGTGFLVGWDSGRAAVVAIRDNVYSYIGINTKELLSGGESYTFDAPTMIYNDVFYMPLVMYAAISSSDVLFEGIPEFISLHRRDLLTDTVVTDTYRLPNQNVATYKGVTIVGTMGMELLSIPDSSAAAYAATINSVAAAMPGSVNVYNIAVPTSCEFYAPKQLYKNQLGSIRKIYAALDERVTPINAVKPLMEHAAEKIYFSTDHHWTQRGAYYVYKAFADVCGFDVPALESFDKNDYWSHVGSFANFTKGTNGASIMKSHPELLERFLPKVDCSGSAYTDMNMTNKYASPPLVNTKSNTYVTFVGGDCPVTRYLTGTKNGRRICIIKESYGNAFATWAVNNYEEVYIIDPREFNGFNGHNARFNLREFQSLTHFDDLVIINYPASICSSAYRGSILNMIK